MFLKHNVLNLGLYFNVNLILVLISVVLTIIVLNFHFRGPKKQRVPKWMRKYFINYLGRLLCFCFDQNDFSIIKHGEQYQDNCNNKFVKQRNLERIYNKEMFLREMQFEETNQINRAEHLSTNTICESFGQNRKVFIRKNDRKISRKYEKNNTRADCVKLDSLQELSLNLEKMLMKLQKSFDPFCLKDEDLKFSILKEILECQRLLLNQNLENFNTNNNLSINEIYDEWKVLAMIMDRICFFFYLFALILSSTIFFFREQVMYSEKN